METPLDSESWSNMQCKKVRFAHKWTVSDFNFYLDKYKEENPILESPKFSPLSNDKLKFNLVLYPKGSAKEGEVSETFLSIYVNLFSYEKQDNIRARYSISVLDNKNVKHNTYKGLKNFKVSGTCWGWEKYITHETLLNTELRVLLPENKLTIFCEIEAIVDTVLTTGTNATNKSIEPKVLDDFGRLLENPILSDVTFVTQNSDDDQDMDYDLYSICPVLFTDHKVHKVILAARSSVFASMFENKATNKITVNDIGTNAFKEMLQFVYTGRVNQLDKLADKILIAANKYELEQLKDLCEATLIEKLTSENVVNCLVLADKHGAKQLRTKAVEYINANLPSIIETDNWKAIKDKPELYFELFSKLLVDNLKK